MAHLVTLTPNKGFNLDMVVMWEDDESRLTITFVGICSYGTGIQGALQEVYTGRDRELCLALLRQEGMSSP